MSSLANLILILLFFTLGYLTKRWWQIPSALPQRINKAVIQFIFPAIILLNIPALEFRPEFLFLIGAPWLVIGVSALVLLLAQRHYRWRPEILCACLVLAGLGNTGNLGYPMLKTFFSAEQASMGIIYDQMGSFIALCTFGSVLISYFGDHARFSWLRVLRRIFLFPPFVALLIALAIPAELIVGPVRGLLQLVSLAIIPLTMFAIGLQFSFRGAGDMRTPLIWTLGLKMLVAPLVVGAAALLLGIPAEMREVALFQAAMPPMVAGAVLLIAQGLAARYAVSVLGFGTLIALAYLPALAWIIRLT